MVVYVRAGSTWFVQPFIDKYGYVNSGVRTGGGLVGFGGYGLVRWRSRRKPGTSQGLDAEGEDQQA